jgi:type III secretory pathway component EscS
MRMLESTVDLLGVLFLGVPPLLVASCIVGSIVAALRAVSHGSAPVSKRH